MVIWPTKVVNDIITPYETPFISLFAGDGGKKEMEGVFCLGVEGFTDTKPRNAIPGNYPDMQ